jgi:hypothetical protein
MKKVEYQLASRHALRQQVGEEPGRADSAGHVSELLGLAGLVAAIASKFPVCFQDDPTRVSESSNANWNTDSNLSSMS